METTISKPLAPEEVREGDYVCILGLTAEFLPCFTPEDVRFGRVEVVRLNLLPWDVAPTRVVAVCVPIVLVENAQRVRATLDMRRYRLARVNERFGRKAFKRAEAKKEE